jgi:probable F420-dependent oxidoreductase
MRFAVRVPVSNRVASPTAMVEAAQLAERLGFHAISVHDRLISSGAWISCGARDAVGDGDDRDMYESIATLSFIAAATSRVRLLTSVILLPLREPILLAKQVAVLDVLSGGRVILGVGVGGQPKRAASRGRGTIDTARGLSVSKEFATLGTPPDRGLMADEHIAAMRTIWTSERATFAGAHVRFEDIEVFPKPVQRGGPPILVGGGSKAALRRAARLGDGWIPNLLRPADYREGVATLERLADEAGRRPSLHALNVFTCVARSDTEALAIFEPTMGPLFAGPELLALNLVGSPSTVVARLREYETAGVELVEMKPIYRSVPELHRMMDVIAAEIMPAFAA